MSLFKRIRPRDVNLELAISESAEVLTFYAFSEPGLSGFSKALSEERDGQFDYSKLMFKKEMQTHTLARVLDEHLPPGQKIDFLNVDVEGLDLQVLRSNNWDKYRPSVILAEDLNVRTLDQVADSEVARFLRDQGYTPLAKTFRTLIFVARGSGIADL
jgi:FkbM family methyltransferase